LLRGQDEQEGQMDRARVAVRMATALAALCLVVAAPDPFAQSEAYDGSERFGLLDQPPTATASLLSPIPSSQTPDASPTPAGDGKADNSASNATAADAIAVLSDSRLGRTAALNAAPWVSAYAPVAPPNAALPGGPTVPDSAPLGALPNIDMTGVRETLGFYKTGDLALGDVSVKAVTDRTARIMLEWIALRVKPREVGYERLMAFVAQHRDWPGNSTILRRAEEALYGDRRSVSLIRDFFHDHEPSSAAGKLALARLRLSDGDTLDATQLVRDVWRKADFNAGIEAQIRKDFSDMLRPEDYKFRADRLLYKEDTAGALRSATLAGADVLALAKARAAVSNEEASDDLLGAVPEALRKDPGYLFAKIQKLRHADKIGEAAQLMLSAPRSPEAIIDGDEWWVERRLIARKLLDQGDAKTAYVIAAEHAATSPASRVEAEFHAGWIALRFLDNASTAFGHFSRAREAAVTPMSRARAAYWQGRAIEALFGVPAAHYYYQAAAEFPSTFYGQLSSAKLGRTDLRLHASQKIATGDERCEAIRVVELLYALGESEMALPLISSTAENVNGEDQLAALAAVTTSNHDAHATLVAGKFAINRGFALDAMAFPSFGVPGYQPTDKSVDKSIVYSITRQESAFHSNALSTAGALGLMQLMPATARRTAAHAGLEFDQNRLTSDPSYNAQVGSTHLGELLLEHGGSYVLTFAAYNAGGKRVKEWIDAYGDPRDPRVDPIDWIELIPISETRNYVQRILENLQIYRLRLGERSTLLIESDLRRTSKSP
jgi:soluble lytic murein transglycosylase